MLLGGAATVLGSLLLPQPARAVTLSAASSATARRVVRRWVKVRTVVRVLDMLAS